MERRERKKLLEKHPYSIWEDKQGKWHTYLPDQDHKRSHIKRNTYQQVEDIVVQYWKLEEENPTIREVFYEWNDYKLNLQYIERSTYDRNRRVFERHYQDFGLKRIKEVSLHDFEEFLESQVCQHKLTVKGFANLKAITRGMLKRAGKKDLISFSVTDLFERLDIPKKSFYHEEKDSTQEVFSLEEEIQMVHYLMEHLDIWNLGILLLFVTGLRVGELVSLTWDCVARDKIHVHRTETKYEDGNGHNIYDIKDRPKTEAGVRDVIIPTGYGWIIDEIRKLNPDGEYLFMRKGKRMTGNTINKRLQRNCEKLGMPKRSTHKIRKTYATILLDNKVDQRLILSQMGHTDIRTTETYYHRDRRTMQEKTAILTPIVTFGIDPLQVDSSRING